MSFFESMKTDFILTEGGRCRSRQDQSWGVKVDLIIITLTIKSVTHTVITTSVLGGDPLELQTSTLYHHNNIASCHNALQDWDANDATSYDIIHAWFVTSSTFVWPWWHMNTTYFYSWWACLRHKAIYCCIVLSLSFILFWLGFTFMSLDLLLLSSS